MTPTLEIRLSEPSLAFVEEQLTTGEYQTPSAFVEALVEEARRRYEAQIDALLLEAVNSSEPPMEVTPEYWEQKRAALLARHQSRSAKS